jgi:hypothetical protein
MTMTYDSLSVFMLQQSMTWCNGNTHQCYSRVEETKACVAVWAGGWLVVGWAKNIWEEHVLCTRPQLGVHGIRLQARECGQTHILG